MRIYHIYLDRIEISIDGDFVGARSLEYKLNTLSGDLITQYIRLPYGQGMTYLNMSHLVDSLAHLVVFSESVDEVSIVDILRRSLCYLRRKSFQDFQINILDHV